MTKHLFSRALRPSTLVWRFQSTSLASTFLANINRWRLPLFLSLFVVTWTLFALLSKPGLDRYGDMVENYAWGQEWQWGYYKHPPVFAWISAAWFNVFPFENLWFYLLSYTNVIAALLVQWRLAATVLSRSSATTAVLLGALLPTTTFLASKYNANTALLLWWPLAALCFVYILRGGSWIFGVLLGASAAAAVLSKYYSLVLLAAMGLYLLLHERRHLRRPAFYIGLGVFLIALIPHIHWLIDTEFLSLHYIGKQQSGSMGNVLWRSLVKFPLTHFGFALLPLGIACYYLRPSASLIKHNVAEIIREQPWLLWLGFGPLGVACVVALITKTPLSTPWGIPHGFLIGVLILRLMQDRASEVKEKQLLLKVFRCGYAYLLLILVLAAPVGFLHANNLKRGAAIPYIKINRWLDNAWSKRSCIPLEFVAGGIIANGVTFYSEGAKRAVYLPIERSPWVSADGLARSGFVVVCDRSDKQCLDTVAVFSSRRQPDFRTEFTVEPDPFWGVDLPAFKGAAWFYHPSVGDSSDCAAVASSPEDPSLADPVIPD